MLSMTDRAAFHRHDLFRAINCADHYAGEESYDIQGERAGAEWIGSLVDDGDLIPGEDILPTRDHVEAEADHRGVTLDDDAIDGAVRWLAEMC